MKKLLIVEDQADVLKLLSTILRAEDRQLFLAESGETALSIARESLPDLILMDVMLPGEVDGYQATRALKADPATAGCAVIIMTAKVQDRDRVEAFESGADDYIGKPFNLNDLKSKVEKYLG